MKHDSVIRSAVNPKDGVSTLVKLFDTICDGAVEICVSPQSDAEIDPFFNPLDFVAV